MSDIPKFIELNDCPGEDTASRWKVYLEVLYGAYLKSVAFGKLLFRDLPVRCRFQPEVNGKHYAFWHIMQEEGQQGMAEEERTIDLERCRRVLWIGWIIANAGSDERIRVFPQAKRHTARGPEQPWALWLYQEGYVVILWERTGYYLLKTAFLVKPHKQKELERDWEKHSVKD